MDVQTYNVAALSGLNVRDIMSLFGNVLYRRHYNEEVQVITDNYQLPAVIDNLIGSWVTLDDGDGGSIFDGYLVPMRMPDHNESISDYSNSLGLSSTHSESETELEESFMSPDITVQQGFLIARVLFGMSDNLMLPPIMNEHTVASEVLPRDNIWEERLLVSRDKWELTSIDYIRVYEGGAVTGSIVLAGDDGIGAEISLHAVAD